MIRQLRTLSLLSVVSQHCASEAHRLFATESPAYHFTKRHRLLNFFRPRSLDDGLIPIVEPVRGSLSGSILRLYREQLERHRAIDALSQAAEMAAEASPSNVSIQHFFGNSWWTPKKAQQPLRKVREEGRRERRSLHALALLRGYNGVSRASLASRNSGATNEPATANRSPRRKRLHTLSLLRGYSVRPSPGAALSGTRRSRRSLHALSLLRGYHSVSSLPAKLVQSELTRPQMQKRVHNLSLLRYDGKLFQNVFSAQDAEKRFQKKRYPYQAMSIEDLNP